jgi:MFS superfamily sulfate permease-like transporter
MPSPVTAPSFPVVMPVVGLVLLLLPIRLQPRQLIRLAFAIWLMGGVLLTMFGLLRLQQDPNLTSNPLLWGGVIALSLVIGAAKGRFVLSKTSGKNIERIAAMTEPQKPVNVYSVKSWVMITLMVGISVALTVFNAPLIWRGAVNLAVGMGLIMSSLNYLKAFSLVPLLSSSPSPEGN